MTTAEVFSNYLGLTPENAPWAFDYVVCPECHGTSYIHNVDESSRCLRCEGRGMATHAYSRALILTATSPLAPEPTPGWLEALIRRGFDLTNYGSHFEGSARECGVLYEVNATHPTHAVARALIAADPALRSACEVADDI